MARSRRWRQEGGEGGVGAAEVGVAVPARAPRWARASQYEAPESRGFGESAGVGGGVEAAVGLHP